MVRNYTKKKNTPYSKQDVEDAMDEYFSEIEGTVSIKHFAEKYNIPRKTLSDHINANKNGLKMNIGAGRNTFVPHPVEEYLVDGIITASELGWPLNRNHIRSAVREYCLKMQVITEDSNFPGKDWMTSFKARWIHRISKRSAEILTKSRAIGLTVEIRNLFYNALEEKLDELKIKNNRQRIFNLDETGLTTAKKTKGSFFKRGMKEALVLAPNEGKTMFTTMFCCNAAGDLLPPYVIYKGTPDMIQSTWVSGGPIDTSYSVTRSGWMEDYVLEAWFKTRFVKWLDTNNVQRPVMLIFDGHGSHITYQMAQIAKENGVCLFCLPPHTCSKLQPLDVGVYGPLKSHWKTIVTDFYLESRLTNVSKAVFPSLLKKLFAKVQERPGNIVNAFDACGICPFNKFAIPEEKLVATLPFQTPPLVRLLQRLMIH